MYDWQCEIKNHKENHQHYERQESMQAQQAQWHTVLLWGPLVLPSKRPSPWALPHRDKLDKCSYTDPKLSCTTPKNPWWKFLSRHFHHLSYLHLLTLPATSIWIPTLKPLPEALLPCSLLAISQLLPSVLQLLFTQILLRVYKNSLQWSFSTLHLFLYRLRFYYNIKAPVQIYGQKLGTWFPNSLKSWQLPLHKWRITKPLISNLVWLYTSKSLSSWPGGGGL